MPGAGPLNDSQLELVRLLQSEFGILPGNESAASNATNCSYDFETDLEVKLPLIGVVGAMFALVGVVANTVLTIALLQNHECRNSYMLHLAAISIGDWFRCFLYWMIFCVEIYFNKLRWYKLYVAWTYYTPALFPIAHMTGLATAYHLIAASTERYLVTSGNNNVVNCSMLARVAAIFAVVVFAALYCLPMYFGLAVVRNPGCPYWEYGYVQIQPTPLHLSWIYQVFYNTYMNNIFQTLLPFAILLCLNFAIIVRLKASIRLGRAMFGQFALAGSASKRQQAQLRSATITLIVLMSGYLIVCFPSVVLVMVERIASLQWQKTHHTEMSFAIDSLTLMHLVNASMRFVVYVACNTTIRKEFFKVLRIKLKRPKRRNNNAVETSDLRVFMKRPISTNDGGEEHENGHIKVVSTESLRLLG